MPRLDHHALSLPRLTVLGLLLASAPGCVFAQEAPTAEEQRLQTLEQELKAGEAEKLRLQQRQEAVTRELATLRTDMIATAKIIQEQEQSLTGLEERLSALEATERDLKSTLGVRDEQLQRVAMALQRMALRPTEAVTLSPLKPDDAVRTAILLRAAVPGVQASAKELEGELAALYSVRSEVQDQQQKVALAAAGLIDKRQSLAQKEQEKSKLQMELSGASDAATAKLQKLASEAADLKDLVAKITVERAKREAERKVAEAKRAAEEKAAAEKAAKNRIVLRPPPGVAPAKPAETQTASLPPQSAPAERGVDLRPFSKARGTMPFPAMGSLKRRYGEGADDPGALSKGIVIAARSGGQVIAPFDGTVAFAGPFRGYGLLLIIEHSEGYHTLLAGLGRIDSVIDQRVFAGEPVGVMDSQGASDLYVELRQNGQPVNPLPWLTSRNGKSSG